MSKALGSKKYTPVMDGLWDWKHYQKMGTAIFLYGELLSRTDRNGKVQVTYTAIQEETGINIRTLERWMRVLKREGYITVSGKNPMSIEIQKFRLIRNGRIPSNMSGPIPSNMSGQENPTPSKVAETPQKLSGPDSVTPLETGTSKPSLKDKKKRKSPSHSNGSQSNPKADQKTNPNIKVAIDHFHAEYLRIHEIKPRIDGGKHGAVYKRILEGGGENGNAPLSIDKLKEVITSFLLQKKKTLTEAGYPIEWLENSINGLTLKKKDTEELEVSL